MSSQPPQQEEVRVSVLVDGIYGTDRTMPRMLAGGTVTEVEWMRFCDEIDDALSPLNRIHKLHRCCFAISFLGFFAVSALSVLFPPAGKYDDDHYYDDGFRFGPEYLKVLVPIVFVATIGVTSFFVAKKREKAFAEAEGVCERISNRHPELGCRFNHPGNHQSLRATMFLALVRRGDTANDHFVLVTRKQAPLQQPLSDVELGGWDASGATAASTPSADSAFPDLDKMFPTVAASAPASSGGPTTLAGRLEELENARGEISEQEYEEKRKEIVYGV